MSYNIQNLGASLYFTSTSNDGFFLLMKSDIKAIRFVRDDMIKIDTGCCFNSIFIYQHQVLSPFAMNALELTAILNQWLTTFLQGYPNPPSTGPAEEVILF